MASGIARGRLLTTTTESRNMVAVLYYDRLTPVKTRYPVSRGHIAGSSLELIEVKFFLKLTADQVLVFRLDRGLMPG